MSSVGSDELRSLQFVPVSLNTIDKVQDRSKAEIMHSTVVSAFRRFLHCSV